MTRTAGVLVALVLLGACEQERILEGERLDPREPFGDVQAAKAEGPAPISLPAAVDHPDWTHANGNARHRITHPALAAQPAQRWSVSIGAGDAKRHRITADPVVAGGRIFTLDSRARVTAVSTGGEALWSKDLTPSYARDGDASGGGLAFGGGRLFVASAFGQLVALDPSTGDVLWKQRFDAPVTGAPMVADGTVYVTAADASAWAVDAANGRVQWQMPGTPGDSTVMGGSSPALAGRAVLFPSPSGGVSAALRDGGAQLWATTVAGTRPGKAHAGVPGLLGLPVIDGGTAYVGNHSGRIAALDVNSGERLWTADEGAVGPVWPVGGQLFVLTDDGHLVRLAADTGARVWRVKLPYYRDDDPYDRAEIVAHYGPVLAGGRIVVASNDGVIRSFDPVSGELVGSFEVPGGATTAPVIVNGTLYVVSSDGRLHAFR